MFLNEEVIPASYKSISFKIADYLSDDLYVKALIYEPEKVERIIVYLRGGKGDVGKPRPARLMQFAFDHTFVAAPYYRGTHHNGTDEFGGSDKEDVYALVNILRKAYPHAPIYFIGFSRGGIQGLLTYSKCHIDGLILWGGVTSIFYMYEERHDLRQMLRRMVGTIDKEKAAYEAREGLNFTDPDIPVMIIHGTGDTNVSIKHAYMLEEKLNITNTPHRTKYVEGEPHVMRPDKEREVLSEIYEFIQSIEADKKKKPPNS